MPLPAMAVVPSAPSSGPTAAAVSLRACLACILSVVTSPHARFFPSSACRLPTAACFGRPSEEVGDIELALRPAGSTDLQHARVHSRVLRRLTSAARLLFSTPTDHRRLRYTRGIAPGGHSAARSMGLTEIGGSAGGHEADGDARSLEGGLAATMAWRRERSSAGDRGASPSRETRHRRLRPTTRVKTTRTLYALLAGSLHTAVAQNSCISLADSTACSAFSAASISTNSNLTGLFPFLSSVNDVSSFDSEVQSYVDGAFASLRYDQLIGCSNFNSDNTTAFYARYTTSVLCNAIIQNSITPCDLTGEATRPLCAGSCTDYAMSEQEITVSDVCGTPDADALTQIRADFTNCALPANSLTQQCIDAVDNQPDDCGFSNNLGSLCSFCSSSSQNSTDSCCVFSNATERCEGVSLPVVASADLQPVMTVTASGNPSSTGAGGTSAGASSGRGLTGGQIAGIVVGTVLGALLLLGLIIGGCLLFRRRRDSSPATSVFNQPATSRQAPQMSYNDGARDQERAGLAILPGGRVARMAALEGSSSEDQNAMGYAHDYRKSMSSQDDLQDQRFRGAAALAPPPKRSGSLSSGSQFAMVGAEGRNDTSPSSNGGEYTSPESQGKSEQLAFFKDYYSQDEIRASDLVSTLWAYEPRAADEFHLERGDMIKVLGIWDDGWATGVRVRQRAEDWRSEGAVQRDSGMSNGSSRPPDTADEGEVKAFPLVCVCLPQHWKKTIEGESTEGSGPGGYPD